MFGHVDLKHLGRMWCLVSVFVIFNGLVDLHSIKINISFILHVLRFEGIISTIKVVYDLEVMVQIDIACAMVYKLDLSSSSHQWGPHLRIFATRPCTAAEVMTFLFIKGHC